MAEDRLVMKLIELISSTTHSNEKFKEKKGVIDRSHCYAR
jgi:hypothetical protein